MALERLSGGFEKQERERRFEIVRLWREKKIQWKPMENGDRLRPDQEDVETYSRRRKEQRAGFGSEAVGMGETMVMELLDHEGVTKPYERISQTGKKIHSSYDFLASEGIVYPASDLDDQLRGADAMLFMADPEAPREAQAFGIDVTVDRNAIYDKIWKDLVRVRAEHEYPNRLYWYDTTAEEAGENFDEPGEGKIKALNLSVYVPSEWADKYMSPKTDPDDARAIMERLGPFVLKQMRNELEILGMRMTGLLRGERDRSEFIRYPSTEDLIMKLEELEKRKKELYGPKAIRIALQNILEAEEANLDRGFILNPRDEDMLPAIIPGFTGLPRTDQADAAE